MVEIVLSKLSQDLYDRQISANYGKDVRLLSGLEEAAYTWLGVNALQERLGSMKNQFGIIELGGGSVQLAFRIKNGIRAPVLQREDSNVPVSAINVKRFPRYRMPDIEIYGESHLHFGINQAAEELARQEGVRPSFVCKDFKACHAAIERLFDTPRNMGTRRFSGI